MLITETTNKKKIFTVREGIYDGEWQGNFCWLKDPHDNAMFYRFETKHSQRGRSQSVTVTIEGVKAIVKIKTKPHARNSENVRNGIN